MLEKYEAIYSRYQELSIAIGQNEVIADNSRYQAYLKEMSELEPMANIYIRHGNLEKSIEEAKQLSEDPEYAPLAKSEIADLTEQLNQCTDEMKLLLLPRNPDDDKNVILEVRAGTGGEESCLFASDLVRMYEHFAARHKFTVEYMSMSETELGGLKEAVLMISGKGAYSWLKYESGVHRVQRIPVTESSGKKQTSACTVAVLPEAEAAQVVIDPKDIRIDVYRSTGHGGQCINTTDSAVRITHIPTGIVATCQDQKSQIKNREQAMRVLRSRVFEYFQSKMDADYANRRKSQVGTGDRSERIRTYNFHESRVTDHRIGLTIYRIDDIMNGDLDEIINALRARERANLLSMSI